jgi:hypothetical protein
MRRQDVMREARAAGLANHIYVGRLFLWGGLALALLSAIPWNPWLIGVGALFAGIGVWILRRVLKSLSAAPPPC